MSNVTYCPNVLLPFSPRSLEWVVYTCHLHLPLFRSHSSRVLSITPSKLPLPFPEHPCKGRFTGLPLELLLSLSKVENGTWIDLSGTCPTRGLSSWRTPQPRQRLEGRVKLPSLRVADFFSSSLYFPSDGMPVQTRHDSVETLNSERPQVITARKMSI